jgi:subtilisin
MGYIFASNHENSGNSLLKGRDMKKSVYTQVKGLLSALLFVGFFVSDPTGVSVGWGQQETGDLILIFKDEVSPLAREATVKKAGATLRFNYLTANATSVQVLSSTTMAILEQDPDIVAIVPDRIVQAHQRTPGQPPPTGGRGGGSTVNNQVVPAGVERIGAAPGQLPWTGNSVGVAVVDTGIDLTNPDLQPVGSNCFTAFVSCQDDNGHGTHVTGIIAARDNLIDVVPYAVKVLNNLGQGSDSTVMAGLDWIAANWNLVSPPIRVINMSLGRPGTLDDNPALGQAIQALYALGITTVVSAGNDPGREVSQNVPATYPEVMAIASTTALNGSNDCRTFVGSIGADTASWFTTDGKFNPGTQIGVTVSAPGEDKENITSSCFAGSVGILSTKLGGGTTRMAGTSMSAPHVAGVVALMWEKALSLSSVLLPEVARSKIRATADKLGVAPLNSPTLGYTYDGEREGVVWASSALQ